MKPFNMILSKKVHGEWGSVVDRAERLPHITHGSYRPESTFPTKGLHHRWIPVNFVKLFTTALLYNLCEGLLFCIHNFIVDSRCTLSISVEELFFVSFSLAGEWLRIDNEMTFRYFFLWYCFIEGFSSLSW